jgi:hypothetical protein
VNEFLLLYRGFAQTTGWCHVVVGDGEIPVALVGQLEDNPGTSVTNAIEEIASILGKNVFGGAGPSGFVLYEFQIRRLGDIRAAFLRIGWEGQPRSFSEPTWTPADPSADPLLSPLAEHVRLAEYTFAALTTERNLRVVDEQWQTDIGRAQTVRSRVVEATEFRRYVLPTVEVLRQLADAVADVSSGHAGPAADSQGMRELAAGADYSARSAWEQPIEDTHMFGALTLRAAADTVHTLAAALDADRPPIWAHMTVARAALEACVIAEWLNEPGIAYEERVRRGLCERIQSASEVENLGLTDGADVATLIDDGQRFGWDVHIDPFGVPSVAATQRPDIARGVSRLVFGNEEARGGALLWGRLGSVQRVTWWGLQWALMLDDAQPSQLGRATVPIGTDLSKVSVQAICVMRALRAAASARFTLMGWQEVHDWTEAVRVSEAHEAVLRGALT